MEANLDTEATLAVNSRPQGGGLTLDVLKGQDSLDGGNQYSISAADWTDAEANYPLRYHFMARVHDSYGMFDLSLGEETTSSTIKVPLPRGLPISSLRATISNSLGSSTSVELDNPIPTVEDGHGMNPSELITSLVLEAERLHDQQQTHMSSELEPPSPAAAHDNELWDALIIHLVEAADEVQQVADPMSWVQNGGEEGVETSRGDFIIAERSRLLGIMERSLEIADSPIPRRSANLIRVLVRLIQESSVPSLYPGRSLEESAAETYRMFDLLEKATGSLDGQDMSAQVEIDDQAIHHSLVALSNLCKAGLLQLPECREHSLPTRVVDIVERLATSAKLAVLHDGSSTVQYITPNIEIKLESRKSVSNELPAHLEIKNNYVSVMGKHLTDIKPESVTVFKSIAWSFDVNSCATPTPPVVEEDLSSRHSSFLSFDVSIHDPAMDTQNPIYKFKDLSVEFALPTDKQAESDDSPEFLQCADYMLGKEVSILCGTEIGEQTGSIQSETRVVCHDAQRVAIRCPQVPQCYYWSKETLEWSTDGCTSFITSQDGAQMVKCSCASPEARDYKYEMLPTRMLRVVSPSESVTSAAGGETGTLVNTSTLSTSNIGVLVVVAALYATLLLCLIVAGIRALIQARNKEEDVLEELRESVCYSDVMRHLAKAASRKAKGLPELCTPHTPDYTPRNNSEQSLDCSRGSVGATPHGSGGSFFSSGNPKTKKPDIDNIVRTVVSAKYRKLEGLMMVSKKQEKVRPNTIHRSVSAMRVTNLGNKEVSPKNGNRKDPLLNNANDRGDQRSIQILRYYANCVVGGDPSQLTPAQVAIAVFFHVLGILALSIVLPGARGVGVFIHLNAETFQTLVSSGALLSIFKLLVIRTAIVAVMARIIYNCFHGINNERSKRCALEEAIIEKDLRFQSPLHFVDQPELYYSCLQIALVQLRLVEKVLRCDYEAARKDFAASRISVRPDVTDLVTVTDEIQNTRTLLAEFYADVRNELSSIFRIQMKALRFSPITKMKVWLKYRWYSLVGDEGLRINPLQPFDEETKVIIAYDEWVLSQFRARRCLTRLVCGSYYKSMVVEPTQDFPMVVITLSRRRRINEILEAIWSRSFQENALSVSLFKYTCVVTAYIIFSGLNSESAFIDRVFFSFIASVAFCALIMSPLVALGATTVNDSIVRSIIGQIQSNLKTFTNEIKQTGGSLYSDSLNGSSTHLAGRTSSALLLSGHRKSSLRVATADDTIKSDGSASFTKRNSKSSSVSALRPPSLVTPDPNLTSDTNLKSSVILVKKLPMPANPSQSDLSSSKPTTPSPRNRPKPIVIPSSASTPSLSSKETNSTKNEVAEEGCGPAVTPVDSGKSPPYIWKKPYPLSPRNGPSPTKSPTKD